MKKSDKTREQLLKELENSNKRIAELEKSKTERKQAEKKLRDAEANLKNIFNISPGLICVADANTGCFTECNPAVTEILGFTVKEFTSRPFMEFVHPNDRQSTVDEITKQLRGKPVASFENRYRSKDGSYKWLAWQATAADKNGKVYGVATDITERKQAEKVLNENEEKFRDIVEMSPVGIMTVSLTGFVTSCNSAFLVLTGYKYDDFIGKHFTKLPTLRLKDIPKYIRIMESLIKGEKPKPIEFKWVHKNGKVLFGEGRLSILRKKGKITGFQIIATDITERKQVENKLQKNQYYLAKSQEIGIIGTWELDIQKNILIWTDENYKIFGVPQGTEMNYDLFLNCIHPDDRDWVLEKWSAGLNNEPYDIEHRLIVNDKVKWVREKADIEFDTEGNPIMAIGFTQDITERKQAEEELRLHSKLLTNMDEAVYLIRTGDGIIVYVNPAFERMFGYDPKEIIGKHVSIVNATTQKDPEESAKEIIEVLNKSNKWEGEINNIRKDGTTFWCYAKVSTFEHYEYGPVWVSVHTDITERRKVEEEQRLHAAMMDNVAEGVYLVGLDDLLIKWTNEKFTSMFGYDPGEMVGKNVDIVNAPTERTPAEARISIVDVLKETGEWHGQVRNIKSDGTHFWCYANVSIYDHPEYGKVLLSVHTDITERKQAEEELLKSEKKHRTLFETMAQGVIYQDKDGKIGSANPAAERILGLTLDQLQGRESRDPRWRAIHEDGSDFPGDTHPAMIALKTGKEVNNVNMGVFNPALEEYRWININARLEFRTGEDDPFQVYTTFEDITERKQAEEELKQKMKQLERFNKVTVDRELRMIELKREINDLLEKAGLEKKYSSPE